jgi:hypothetical protein
LLSPKIGKNRRKMAKIAENGKNRRKMAKIAENWQKSPKVAITTSTPGGTRSGGLTDCRDGGHDFSELELVQDGRLSGRVQPDHQDPHLLLAEQALEQGGEHVAHD